MLLVVFNVNFIFTISGCKMKEIFTRIKNAGIVTVIKLKSVDQGLSLAQALIEGGIFAAEITFRSEFAPDGIIAIKKKFPEMLLGAGTVINKEYAKKAIEAGAEFLVSPGLNPSVVEYAIEKKVPIIPGVATSSEIEQALSYGLEYLKFFPAEALGGVKMLKALAGPFSNVKFMVTGGISLENITDYLQCKNVFSIGGSWMIKDDFGLVTKITKDSVKALHGFSFSHLGINSQNKDEASSISATLELFGFNRFEKDFCWENKSKNQISFFEVLKATDFGQNGKIGIKTWNVERAISYLKRFNINPNMATASYFDENNQGDIKSVLLDKNLGGFSIELSNHI